MRILVTGGCGFIGSAFVRLLCKKGYRPVIVDKLTYAGNRDNVSCVDNHYKLYKLDIRNKSSMDSITRGERIDTIVNIAAESSVDKSIADCTPFVETNIKGVKVLLEIARKYRVKRFIQISTDEVYGENLDATGFDEDTRLSPSNPYAASKAAADLLIKSYIRTYGFPAVIIRPCNNYGCYQHDEKFIPKIIRSVNAGESFPLHGTGEEKREWIWVEDCAEGIYKVMRKGKLGEVYNLGSGEERRNLEIITLIADTLCKPHFLDVGYSRPGLDRRYFLNSGKIKKLGWKPKMRLNKGILKTIKHYILDKR